MKKSAVCIFCDLSKERIIAENNFAYAIRDGFPVTDLHTLIIPKRHIASYFELDNEELTAIYRLSCEQKNRIEILDPEVTGFNVGINVGQSAGQTVFHCHVHLIPRRDGDVAEPRGGVRHVIPGKGSY